MRFSIMILAIVFVVAFAYHTGWITAPQTTRIFLMNRPDPSASGVTIKRSEDGKHNSSKESVSDFVVQLRYWPARRVEASVSA